MPSGKYINLNPSAPTIRGLVKLYTQENSPGRSLYTRRTITNFIPDAKMPP